MINLSVSIERWPIAGTFTIARGSKTEAVVVVAEITDGAHTGRGECVPYARYGESVEGTAAAIEAMRASLADGITREALQEAMPAGAARNALDCALWDLEAKRTGRRAWEIAGIPAPKPVITAYTLSLDTPEAMGEAAKRVLSGKVATGFPSDNTTKNKAAHHPLLKIKLGQEGDRARIDAIRAAAPNSRLMVDANEGWTPQNLEENLCACADAGVVLIEQPLPAKADEMLARIARPVPICADESVHDRASLKNLTGRYDAINIKLDKTGGLTEALLLAQEADALGLKIMVGCMLATSLAMAPALLLTPGAVVVDLDGPLLLAKDRENGLKFEGGLVHPPEARLWG